MGMKSPDEIPTDEQEDLPLSDLSNASLDPIPVCSAETSGIGLESYTSLAEDTVELTSNVRPSSPQIPHRSDSASSVAVNPDKRFKGVSTLELLETFDWSKTHLGPRKDWSQSLR